MADVDPFDVQLQERLWRQQFMFNAFRALTFNGIDGDYAEFGSCRGKMFSLAYLESKKHQHPAMLWAFDSLQHLLPASTGEAGTSPEEAAAIRQAVAEFERTCADNGIPESVRRHIPGIHERSLESMPASAVPQNIALACVYCECHLRARSVLSFLMPRLKHGMIIAFDGYYRWSASQISGQRRAMLEAFTGHERWVIIPFMQYGWHGLAFAVEDRTVLGSLK